mgnify:FL=1
MEIVLIYFIQAITASGFEIVFKIPPEKRDKEKMKVVISFNELYSGKPIAIWANDIIEFFHNPMFVLYTENTYKKHSLPPV